MTNSRSNRAMLTKHALFENASIPAAQIPDDSLSREMQQWQAANYPQLNNK